MRRTCSEPERELPGFATHLAKHFSLHFWEAVRRGDDGTEGRLAFMSS